MRRFLKTKALLLLTLITLSVLMVVPSIYQILGRDGRLLGIAGGLTDAHVDDDLVETRKLHLVVVLELLEHALANQCLYIILR